MTYTDPAPELSASLELSAVLRSGLDQLDRTMARRLQPLTAQPVFYRTGGSIIPGATGVAFIEIGGPPQGHLWYVRQLAIGGIDPTLAALGVGDVFISAANLAGSPSLMDWRDRADRLPSIAFYGTGEMELRHNERLLIRLSGATNAQQYAAAVSVQDMQESAAPQEWGL